MGKIKFSEIDKNNILSFLEMNKKNIDKEWVIWAGIVNIVVLFVSLYVSGKNIYTGILVVAINLCILINMIYFWLKVEENKKIYICILGFTQLCGQLVEDVYYIFF